MSEMDDLHERLAIYGFDEHFLREVVLPDWWSDDLADVPGNRAMAEAAIARYFGYKIKHLRDHDCDLGHPPNLPRCNAETPVAYRRPPERMIP